MSQIDADGFSRPENPAAQAGKRAEAGVESHQLDVRGERESGKIDVLPAFGFVGERYAESAEVELKTFRLVLEAETLVPEERVPRFPSLKSALYIGAHGDRIVEQPQQSELAEAAENNIPVLLNGIQPGERSRVMHMGSVAQRNEDVNVRQGGRAAASSSSNCSSAAATISEVNLRAGSLGLMMGN